MRDGIGASQMMSLEAPSGPALGDVRDIFRCAVRDALVHHQGWFKCDVRDAFGASLEAALVRHWRPLWCARVALVRCNGRL